MKENTDIKKILIVEDETAYSRALDLKLKNIGFDVVCVQDGLAALNNLKKENFDLLLTDLVLPKMNGFELLQELINNNIKLPVIVLSNLTQDEDKKKVKALGAQQFLEKSSITISEIIKIILDIFKK